MAGDHILFKQIKEAQCEDEDILELYEDLKYIFDNPFDPLINDAVVNRQAIYVPTNEDTLH